MREVSSLFEQALYRLCELMGEPTPEDELDAASTSARIRELYAAHEEQVRLEEEARARIAAEKVGYSCIRRGSVEFE